MMTGHFCWPAIDVDWSEPIIAHPKRVLKSATG